jgi:hypothetical protein
MVVSKNVTNTGKHCRFVIHFFTKIATVVQARQVIEARPALRISSNASKSNDETGSREHEKHHQETSHSLLGH